MNKKIFLILSSVFLVVISILAVSLTYNKVLAASFKPNNTASTFTFTIQGGNANDTYDSKGNKILKSELRNNTKVINLNASLNGRTAELPIGTQIYVQFPRGQFKVSSISNTKVVQGVGGKFHLPLGDIAELQVVGEGTTTITVTNVAGGASNWGGYLRQTGGPFTDVTGDWTVPTATCGSNPTDSSHWIGIGGGNGSNPDLIQTGTEADCSSGTASYQAWWEIVPSTPNQETPINSGNCQTIGSTCGVSANDHMTAEISEFNSTTWTITIEDITQGWTWSSNEAFAGDTDGSNYTAEWILEAPQIGTYLGNPVYQTLTNYGSATFSSIKLNASSPLLAYSTDSVDMATTSADTTEHITTAVSAPNSTADGFTAYYCNPVTGCATGWTDISQSAPASSTRMFGITAVSPTNVWVVGMGGTGPVPMAYNYNGSSWTAHNPSAISASTNNLFGATSDNSGNVWAVGEWFASPNLDTLVYKWNGSSWSWKSSYNPSSNWENRLNAVSTDNSGDVYAVGYADVTSFSDIQPLIEKWNGTSFVNVSISKPTGCTNAALYGVSVYSSTNIWASGQAYCGTSGNVYVIYHYDGTNWTSTKGSTIPGSISTSILYGIKAVSSTEAWAVGSKTWVTGSTYALHTTDTGSTWTEDTSASTSGSLVSVDADSPDDVWATSGTFTMHYDGLNGVSWVKVSTPTLPSGRILNNIAVNSDIAWIVGYSGTSTLAPLELKSLF